jgi:hypothetical protein
MMNTYVICGAQKTTGADVRVELQASTENEARQAAIKEGILITECTQLTNETHTSRSGDVYLREITLWLRFFGISTAIALFAVVVKLVMTH